MMGFDFGIDRLVIGVFTGLTYGLLAVGLVLVYRSSKFVNFAHGSIGAFGASVLGALVVDRGAPYWVAFPVAIVVAGALAALVEIAVVRRLTGRPSLIGMIATLGLSQFILVLALIINTDGISGFTFPEPAGFPSVELGTLVLGPPYLAMLVFAPILLFGLSRFLRDTRVGMGMRAAADDKDTALLEGIPAKAMTTLAWAIAGGVAAFSAILVTPTTAGQSIDTLGPDLLLKGLAGAVFARMSSIPMAISASIGVGVLEQVLLSNPDTRSLVSVVIGGSIVIALLRQPELGRAGLQRERWRRIIVEPLPEAYGRVRAIAWLPRALVAVLAVVAVGLASVVSNNTASVLISVAGFALVGLSVGLLTGTLGQLSLGQFAYAGIGAAISVQTMQLTDNFVIGALGGVAAAALAATLIGIPALRLKGLALAVSTLAFALATTAWLLRQGAFLGDGVQPPKPTWFGFTLDLAVHYYLFALLMLALGLWVAGNLRRSGFGLALAALRDNEDAARAFTVPSRRRKLQLYALSGAIAGLGGVVIGHSQTLLTVNSFPASASIDVVALTVIGGLGVTAGPLIGALVIVGLPGLLDLGLPGQAVLALAWLAVVVLLPEGLGGLLVRLRDRVADALARRAGIDVVAVREGDGLPKTSPLQAQPDLTGLGQAQPASLGGGPILMVSGLSRRFGGVVAVDGVDLVVNEGEILGIIGPNGAGKTTMFEMIAGFTSVDTGEVVFEGRDVTGVTPEGRAQLGLVRSFQDAALFPSLTVREAIMVARERIEHTTLWSAALGVRTSQLRKAEATEELMERLRLTPYADVLIAELSTGTRRVVEIACLLTLQPRVLLLDEPSAGIAQTETDALGDLLLGIREQLGTTMVIIEHDLPLLSRLSDRMLAMNLGTVIASGTPDEVRNHPDVVRSYLGMDAETSAAVHRSGPGELLGAGLDRDRIDLEGVTPR
ncbi:ATP-binding cassette domain-containing protein [Nocardioides sp.]|uniref:ABC transporter permease subunit n=1 Tax=Nocardioides sp. TaxID=35761 RepID=UPI0035685063